MVVAAALVALGAGSARSRKKAAVARQPTPVATSGTSELQRVDQAIGQQDYSGAAKILAGYVVARPRDASAHARYGYALSMIGEKTHSDAEYAEAKRQGFKNVDRRSVSPQWRADLCSLYHVSHRCQHFSRDRDSLFASRLGIPGFGHALEDGIWHRDPQLVLHELGIAHAH